MVIDISKSRLGHAELDDDHQLLNRAINRDRTDPLLELLYIGVDILPGHLGSGVGS